MLTCHKHRKGTKTYHYTGLDVSLEETAICVIDDNGRIEKKDRTMNKPQTLSEGLWKFEL